MATPLDWSIAYRAQAEEDFKAAMAARHTPSVYVMLLQMTFEKIAKAVYCKQQNAIPTFSHSIGAYVWQFFKRDRVPAFDERAVDRMVSLLFEIESANPAVVNKTWKAVGGPHPAQLEYPWEETGTGFVRTPLHDLPLAKKISDAKEPLGPTLERFADTLLRTFDTIFP